MWQTVDRSDMSCMLVCLFFVAVVVAAYSGCGMVQCLFGFIRLAALGSHLRSACCSVMQ